MIGSLASVVPLATLSLLTAAALVPWVTTSSLALTFALLPAATLHYWALRRPSAIPSLAVLFSGLATDIILASPPGFWTTINALAWAIGLMQRPLADQYWKFGRWGLFAIAMTGCVAAMALIGQALAAPAGSLIDLLIAWIAIIAVYPLFAGLIHAVDFAAPEERFNLEND